MTTLPRSRPRATISIQMLLFGFDGPPISIAAVFGSVGPDTSVVALTVCENEVVVVVGEVVVVVVVDEELVVVVVEDEDVVVVVDELDVVVVVVPSQPWLSVTTALLSTAPS